MNPPPIKLLPPDQRTPRYNPPFPYDNPQPGDTWGPYKLDSDGWWRLVKVEEEK